jgi:hypothetical protein
MFNRKRLSFAAFCRDVLDEPISPAWIVAYKAFDGESLTGDEMETWRTLTGRDSYEPNAARELVAVKGRRAQGTKTACKYLAYAIHTADFRQFAAKSDRLHVPIIAQSRDVAGEIMSYLTAFYQETELRSEVEEILKASIRLRNGFVISTQTCSYRAPRGITAPLALLDEVGVWRIEGSDIDKEVLRSLTPAMVQFPNRKLIVLGSPWVKAGVLFDAWQRRNKISAKRLVIHAPTHVMNPRIPTEELASEQAADPLNFRREFLAEFVDDVGQFLSVELIESAVVRERTVLPYVKGKEYRAFCDPSGGRSDSMCLGIGHAEGDRAILDLLEEVKPPFAPQDAVKRFCVILESYHCSEVVGDAYSGEWVRQEFSKYGVTYRLSERTKSEIYLALLPLLTGGCCELLDDKKLITQLAGLERTTGRGGRDSVDHMKGTGHDDSANAASGVLTLLRSASRVLGVVEWLKNIAAGIFSPSGETKPVPQPALKVEAKLSVLQPQDVSKQEMPVCEKCGATCVTAVSGQYRCNQCGFQWWMPNAVLPEKPITRADILSGRYTARRNRNFW